MYTEIAAGVADDIREFGAPIELRRLASAEYNAQTSEVEGDERRWRGFAVRTEYKLNDIDGEMIQRGDGRLLVSTRAEDGSPMEQPMPGDRAHFDGAWHQVIACDPVKPATTAVVYEVQVRR